MHYTRATYIQVNSALMRELVELNATSNDAVGAMR